MSNADEIGDSEFEGYWHSGYTQGYADATNILWANLTLMDSGAITTEEFVERMRKLS